MHHGNVNCIHDMSTRLGSVIKKHREQKGASIAQAALSIGIDRTYLSKIEHGHETPPPNVFNSILNYLDVDRFTALKIAKVAGYQTVVHFSSNRDYDGKGVIKMQNEQSNVPADAKQVNMPGNVPVLYTDSIFVNGSKWGVVLDIAQNVGPTNQQNVVARIGMSREHAEALVDVLAKQLTKDKLQRAGTSSNTKN